MNPDVVKTVLDYCTIQRKKVEKGMLKHEGKRVLETYAHIVDFLIKTWNQCKEG